MRHRDYLEGLAELHRVADEAERRALWRQSLADLAAAVADTRRAVPLEGLDPTGLLASVQQAFATGLVDDVEFLSPAAANAALYELAAALPPCELKRELGRRVLRGLTRGDAETFVAVATQLAVSSSHRALASRAARARVALSLDLPLGMASRADGLALALISRRELAREWLTLPSQGALPSRVLASRLLERAAREAARRHAAGDDAGVRVFETPLVVGAWDALLADRESLVWQHVAAARGLLARSRPTLGDEVDRHLATKLGVTEWRRAAASLAASIAIDPERALKRARQLFRSNVAREDPGVAAAMIAGLPRAAEREPEAVEGLLVELLEAGGLGAAEALVELRRERLGTGFGDAAAAHARTLLEALVAKLENDPGRDDGQLSLARCVLEDLAAAPAEPSVRALVDRAQDAFVAEGAEAAAKVAHAAVQAAEARMALLEGCGSDADPAARHTAFRALRELDLALLESETLASLLGLGTRGDAGGALRPLANLFQRMTTWLLLRERAPLRDSELPHFTLRLRRLRALLHCVDADGRRIDDRGEVLRKRRFDVAQVLLRRTAADVPSGLRRAVSATTARAGDALVREEHVEVSDVVLAAASHVQRPEDAAAMGEASMVPEVRTALRAYARLASRVGEFPARGRPTAAALRSALEALIHLGHDLPIATSPRVEALRTTLHDLGFALETVAASGSLKELAEHTTGDTPLAQLERTATTLAKLVRGTRVRLGLDAAARAEEPSLGIAIRGLDLQLERSLRTPGLDLSQRLTAVARALRAELPPVFAAVAIGILARLVELPHDGPRRSQAPSLRRTPRETALPAWVPASRVLGGFYVKRAIGTGAAGSVFVATRAEARSDEHAERFALKTPDYSGAAARTLSESEFLRLFRQEAGTLLGLPAHENIARFVTFDAGARPKPILVMELVEGPNLERLLEGQDLDMDRALDLLEGIAKGLEAMHGAGVAHLDIKPSNIIVREAFAAATEGGPASAHPGPRREEPVLVDFGLAGKHLRPGCGTVHYGAPEIWGQDVSGEARPTPADVYAFGCLAYELMTGRTLFDDPNEVAVITAHLQHDGLPEPVSLLQQDDHTTGFAEIVRRCIRRDPRERVAMKDVVKALGRVRSTLKRRSWPLARADR